MHRKSEKVLTIIHEDVMDLGCEPQNRESGHRNTATYTYNAYNKNMENVVVFLVSANLN